MAGVKGRSGGAVTDYHVITPEPTELVMQVTDGQSVNAPPPLSALQPLCGGPTTDAAHMVG